MNILLINHYAGSPEMGMEFRPYYFAREWVRAGHHVQIIAGDFSHLRKENPKVEKDLQYEDVDGIQYCWIKTGRYEGNGLSRALTMFRFCYKLRKYADRILEKARPDVIITSSTYPLDTFPAQYMRKKCHAKLIHEVHDMWPATLIELGGMSKYHPFVQMIQVGENSAYRKSDKVVSLLPCAKDYMVRHGMKADKFVCIENGVVDDDWKNPLPLPQGIEKELTVLKEDGKFIVGYFGGHALSNALGNLLKAAEKIHNDKIHFVLVGKGIEKEKLKTYAKEHRLQNISFFPAVQKGSIPNLLKYFDISYCGAKESALYQYGISLNKIYDSLYAGVPILLAFHANGNLIEKYHCGAVSKGDPAEIAKKIEDLFSMENEEKMKMSANGKKIIEEKYLISKLALDFINIMS